MPRASSAALSAVVIEASCVKRVTSSLHCRMRCAYSTDSAPVARTPSGWSRTSQPWQYGQCRRSRPPALGRALNIGQLVDGAGGEQYVRGVDVATVRELECESGARIDNCVLGEGDAVTLHLSASFGKEVRRRHPVTRDKSVHVRRHRI